MENYYYFAFIIGLLFIISFATRALPFFISKFIAHNTTLQSICAQLPAFIIFLLVIYELNLDSFASYPYGIPELAALAVVVLIHVWRRMAILSIIVGTLAYILFNYLAHLF